jgi:hypothetical protein
LLYLTFSSVFNVVSHLWPFNDGAYDYVRVVGPGVIVGRWWIEGKDLETIPKKVADFIIVQDFGSMWDIELNNYSTSELCNL